MPEVNPILLEILACPVPECRAALRLDADELVCVLCGRRYRFEQNWPVLIPEEARLPQAGA